VPDTAAQRHVLHDRSQLTVTTVCAEQSTTAPLKTRPEDISRAS
jgi:hypothetical protein